MIVLRPPFFCAWFGPARAVGDEVAGNVIEQQTDHFAKPSGFVCKGAQVWRPGTNGIKRSPETKSHGVCTVVARCSGHERSHEVVVDEVHPEFAAYHGWGFAAQDISAEGGLDVAQEELRTPTFHIERAKGGFGEAFRIEDRGNEPEFLGAETSEGQGDFHFAHNEVIWQ